MKKTNTNKVNAGAKQAKANNVAEQTKATAAQTKTNNNAKQFTVKPHEGCSVTIENKTFDDMKSWAYHLTKDIDNLCIDINYAVEDGSTIDFIPYTEDELNEMIAMAGFAINVFDPNDTEVYRDYYNAYGCCKYIIARCLDLIHVLNGNYDGFGWVKPKYKHSELPINIENVYHRLYTAQANTGRKLITEVPYTHTELYSFSARAAHTLDVLDRYDCSDICNVEVTKYLCNEVINIVNDLLDTIENNDAISCQDDTSRGYEEYFDF